MYNTCIAHIHNTQRHEMYNTVIAHIHNTQRHELYKEAITYIINVVNRSKVNVFKAM